MVSQADLSTGAQCGQVSGGGTLLIKEGGGLKKDGVATEPTATTVLARVLWGTPSQVPLSGADSNKVLE